MLSKILHLFLTLVMWNVVKIESTSAVKYFQGASKAVLCLRSTASSCPSWHLSAYGTGSHSWWKPGFFGSSRRPSGPMAAGHRCIILQPDHCEQHSCGTVGTRASTPDHILFKWHAYRRSNPETLKMFFSGAGPAWSSGVQNHQLLWSPFVHLCSCVWIILEELDPFLGLLMLTLSTGRP